MKNFFLNTKKGYYKFIKLGKLSFLREVIAILHQTNFINSKEKFHDVEKSKILRQYFGQKLLYQRFIWIFFYFQNKKKKIIFPLPLEWSKILKERNIRVNIFLSYLSYLSFLFYQFLKGILFLLVIIIKYFIFLTKKKTQNYHFNNSIIFYNISSKKINLKETVKFNLHVWFKEKFSEKYNLVFIHQNNDQKFHEKNLYETNCEFKLFYPYLKFLDFLKNVFIFFLEFRKISLLPYNFILFEENIKLIFFKSLKKVDLKKILIIWTSNIYKPLWIYELESNGTEVILFFNGFLNEIRLDKSLKLNHDHEGLINLTWKNFYTWDEINSQFLKKKIDYKFNSIVKGPIYFTDNNNKLNLPNNSIAVFGYENHKQNIGINTISDYEYCNKDFLKIFYEDILELCKIKGFKLILKRKNELNHLEIKKNKKFFKKLSEDSHIIFVDPNISAFRVIEKTKLVISMPFTSTAKIGEFMNKPSIYYDPFSWIQKNDPSGSNIQLIQGKMDLSNFLDEFKN